MSKAPTRYRKPDKGALHIRQVPELGTAFRTWFAEHEREWDYFDDSIGQESLVNNLIIDFLDSSPEDQAKLLGRSIVKQEAMELAWNRKMKILIDRGEYELDKKGIPVRCKAGASQQQQQPDVDGHDATGGHGARRSTPKPSRKRA